jgi:phenylacetate-CoA ligase
MSTALPDYQTGDPALSTMPREQLVALQEERLRAMVAYVHETSPFWQRKLAEAGVAPGDINSIADLPRLPLTTRAELDAEQAAHPPFGDYTCSPREQWMGLFTTSGTSGRKLKRVVSRRDWRLMIDRFYRMPAPPPGEMFMLLGPACSGRRSASRPHASAGRSRCSPGCGTRGPRSRRSPSCVRG